MNPRFFLLIFDVIYSASRFGSGVKIGTIAALAIGALGTTAYFSFQGNRTLPRPVPQTLAEAIEEVSRDIPRQLPVPDRALRPTLLLPLNGDREGLFTEQLRSALDQHGWYRPVETTLLNQAFAAVRDVTGIGTDPSVRSMQWTPDELARMTHSANAEVALRGRLDRFSLLPDNTVEVQLRLELWELSGTGAELIASLHIERPLPAPPDEVTNNRRGGLGYYAIAFLIALVFPFAMYPWMRWAIREDSNAAIAQALLGITAIPLLAFVVFLIWQGNDVVATILQGGIVALLLLFYTAFVLNIVQNKVK